MPHQPGRWLLKREFLGEALLGGPTITFCLLAHLVLKWGPEDALEEVLIIFISPVTSCSDFPTRCRSSSHSPSKKKCRPCLVRRSSISSSHSFHSTSSASYSPLRRYSYSSSCSGSWDCSWSWCTSPEKGTQWGKSQSLYRPTYRSDYGEKVKTNIERGKKSKEKVIEEH